VSICLGAACVLHVGNSGFIGFILVYFSDVACKIMPVLLTLAPTLIWLPFYCRGHDSKLYSVKRL